MEHQYLDKFNYSKLEESDNEFNGLMKIIGGY